MIISQRSDTEFWESVKDQSFLPADALLMQFTKYAGQFQKQLSKNTCRPSSCAREILTADGPEIAVKPLLNTCYSILYLYLLVQHQLTLPVEMSIDAVLQVNKKKQKNEPRKCAHLFQCISVSTSVGGGERGEGMSTPPVLHTLSQQYSCPNCFPICLN